MSRHRRLKLDEVLTDFEQSERLEAIFQEIEEIGSSKIPATTFLFSDKVKTADGLQRQRHEAFPASAHHPLV
jgi:hypothetical protein